MSCEEEDSPTKKEKEESFLDQCMRNMEELKLEVSMEYGGEFDLIDPVMSQYKIFCNSIYALLKEENLIDILKEAKEQLKL